MYIIAATLVLISFIFCMYLSKSHDLSTEKFHNLLTKVGGALALSCHRVTWYNFGEDTEIIHKLEFDIGVASGNPRRWRAGQLNFFLRTILTKKSSPLHSPTPNGIGKDVNINTSLSDSRTKTSPQVDAIAIDMRCRQQVHCW